MQRIVPAILASNPEELREGLKLLKEHTRWVHVDIMDGKFVPNISINLFELGEAFQFFHLEIHLMMQNPEKYLEDCKGIEAKRVIFHVEASHNPKELLEQMQHYGFQKAMALNPQTPVSQIASYLDKLDAVLVMSVNPGFQAQEFIPSVLSKIQEIRKLKHNVLIGLDGGINAETIIQVFDAGADYVGVGSAVMKAQDPVASLRRLEELVDADTQAHTDVV